MATVNYYIDPATGNDAWDGTSQTFTSGTIGPKEHIQAMTDTFGAPITDEIIINLAGTVASQVIYTEPAMKLSFAGLRFKGAGASLTIRPTIWDENNYNGGGDPYGGAGSWDPTDSNKPCVIPPVDVTGVNQPIKITGVIIGGIYPTTGIKVDFGSALTLNYCAIGTFGVGAHVNGGGLILVNSVFTKNGYGIIAENNAQVFCYGDNYIHNSLLYGIVVRWRSNLSFGVWWIDNARYTMDITTELPRQKYSAIHAEGMSLVKVIDPTPDPFVVNQAAVKILNPGLIKNDDYFGVSLESGAMLIGAQAIDFSMPINGQWTLTVPKERQFVWPEGSGVRIIR